MVEHDPMAAVPIVPEGVSSLGTPDGGIELSRKLKPKNRIQAWYIRTFHYDYTVRARLDANGALFWSLLDGRRTVRQVAAAMAARLGVAEDAARQGVVKYIGALMRRGWLQLRLAIPPAPQAPAGAKQRA